MTLQYDSHAVGIRSIAGYLPGTQCRNADVAERLGFKREFLEEKVGVETRYISATDESTSDMCVRAFESLRRQHPGDDFGDVGLLLLCTQNPDRKIPHTSSILQFRLNLPKSLLAFDISLGCSGYVSTLVTAKALMQELRIRRALVFTCDPYSKVVAPNDKSTAPLFSDAASVSLLEAGAPLRIGRGTFGNDGSAYEALIIKGSGTALDGGVVEQPLRMDGRRIFAMLKKEVPSNIHACLELNGLSLADVDLFLFHQASAWLLSVLRTDMNIDPDRVPSNLKRVGNTVSTSIPLLLEELMRAGDAPRNLLLSGFGVGLSWGSVLVSNEASRG